MANSLEIFQNTLLKLVVRSGPDSDRQNVVLDVGEIGYTTDTKRLYVGDGSTLGGKLAGNVIFGDFADFAAITSTPAPGDLLYITGNSTLYRYNGGVATLSTSWSPVGRIYSASDTTLVFSNSGNQIRVGTLSAGNFSNNALGRNLTLDTGKIVLSSAIAIDQLKPLNTTFVSLPSSLQIGNLNYQFPSLTATDSFLTNDGNGNLKWRTAATLLTAASAALVPGPGLSLLVNGVSSTRALLLTSGDIQINGNFIPTAFVEFNQAGTITRSVGVSSISVVSYSSLTAIPNVGGPVPLVGGSGRGITEPANISGAWRIRLTSNVSAVSSIVEVGVKNARYYSGLKQAGYIYTPSLESRYFFTQSTGNEIILYTYIPIISEIPNTTSGSSGFGKSTFDLAYEYLTPGSQDTATRFSVTVYGQ
jgi:hypothetical protein